MIPWAMLGGQQQQGPLQQFQQQQHQQQQGTGGISRATINSNIRNGHNSSPKSLGENRNGETTQQPR